MSLPTVTWLSYTLTVCVKEAPWNNVAGIYIFAQEILPGKWQAHYVGQTDSFQNRIPSHEQWEKARVLGATHVLAMSVPQAAMRDQLEKELIREFQPVLNTQLMP